MNWLVCVAGGIASGKTTLADTLHAQLPGSVKLSFGDVVRRRARLDDVEPTRQNLQDTGMQLIREGWPAFVDGLLADLNGDPPVLIVEGVRHPEAVHALHDRLPARELLLVFLDVCEEHRRYRLAARTEGERVLQHDVERDVENLRQVADLVLPSSRPAQELGAAVIQRMRDVATDHRPDDEQS